MAISSPLQSKVPTGSAKTIKKLQTILLNRTKVRREIFQRQTILQNRRIENERRKQREDELEAPNLVTKPRGAAGLIAGSAKGFFGRLMGFLSYLTAGWIINNLPTWIAMGKEFIARTQQMGKILGGFITNTTDIFKNFTKLLGAGLTNLMKFDFLDTSGRVSTAFDELNLSVENWGTGFEDVIKLITTPLTEGIASGEDAPSTGTQITDEGAYETSAPYSGSGGSTTTYSSTGGQKLTDPGGKDYGYYRSGADGSRGSARVHGADGQKRGHTGEDYAMPTGTALTMIAPGTVVDAVKGDRYNGGYGEFVVVQLDDGRYVKLAHLDSINVKKGDKVGAGTGPNGTAKVIGRSGSTGLGSGPHLHLDVAKSYDSNSYMVSGTMDPKSFIDGGGLVKGGKVTATGVVTQTKPSASQPQQNLMGTSSSSSSSGSGRFGTKEEIALNDAISFAEGTKSSYGTMFGGGISKDLESGKLTVKQVIDLGDAHAKKNGRSGAAGRYQFMPFTLEDLVRTGDLKMDDKFTPQMQDKASIALARRRKVTSELLKKEGLSAKVSNMLAPEWASLPTYSGASYYGQPVKSLSSIQSAYKNSLGSPQTQTQAQSQSPTPSPAQITPTGTPQNPQIPQSLAPERTGQTVFVSQNPSSPARQMMYSGGGGSSGGGSSQISDFALLNNFIKNKLLLDLAYL
jgi:murein DD-endopeptidase MepM/ murein hydrolase activator NlpD/muramidase (phage lysozyme)